MKALKVWVILFAFMLAVFSGENDQLMMAGIFTGIPAVIFTPFFIWLEKTSVSWE